jgi:mitotic-spindle organizing protein 1
MSQILNCQLDRQQLAILVGMIENGVNPDALAHVVNEMKTEAASYSRMNSK